MISRPEEPSNPPTTTLHLPAVVRRRVSDWVCAGYPRETCGLLLGLNEGSETRVLEVRQAKNLNTQRAGDRYKLDPGDHLRAEQAARDSGLEIVGVWHSHPDHPAEPSETDRAAAWEGWSYAILAVSAAGVLDIRSWRLFGAAFHEEDVQP